MSLRATLRVLGFLTALGWGWFIVAYFRTQQFGFSPTSFAVAAVFVLPVAVVPFLGRRWTSVAAGAVATVLLAVATAEVSAGLEEAGFRRAQAANGPLVFRERHWPFGSHHLVYDPASGRFAAGD